VIAGEQGKDKWETKNQLIHQLSVQTQGSRNKEKF
jgi:hypothetical protein